MAPEPPPNNTTTNSSNCSTEEEQLLDLTLLPNELLEKVFTHLDLRTFKSIRQVSTRFRSLASTKESLLHFLIGLRPSTSTSKKWGQRALSDLLTLTETLPWSHLLLDDLNSVELASGNSALAKNLDKLSLALKSRHVRCGFGLKSITCPLNKGATSTWDTLRPFLLHCGETLEKIGVLRMMEVRKVLQALAAGGVKSFPKLRHLSIAVDMVDGEYAGNELEAVLNMCEGLRRLDFLFADQDEHPMTRNSFETAVLEPILTFLGKRRDRGSTLGLTINFDSEGQKASIPFNFRALEKLLYYSKSREEASEGIHLSLENVPFLALPTKRSLTRVQGGTDPDILERLNYTVKSIRGTNQDLKLSTMEIERDSFHASCRHFMPPSAIFSLILHLPTGNKIYLTCPSQLLPVDVQRIIIVSENTRASLLLSISDEGNQWGEDKNKSFIEDLLVSRPGLEELRIVTENDRKLDLPFMTQDSVNFKHIGSFNNFPNLKVLHLDYWGRGGDEDFYDLYGLMQLEELVLRRCYRLRDASIVGDGKKNSMLQLKNLKHLVLDGYWSITDTSFAQVFSKLGLKSLQVFDDPDKNEKSITMKALHSLPNSPCGLSLELLKINKPFKSSLNDVKKSLIHCRALKRVEILEGAGAGGKINENFIVF